MQTGVSTATRFSAPQRIIARLNEVWATSTVYPPVTLVYPLFNDALLNVLLHARDAASPRRLLRTRDNLRTRLLLYRVREMLL
jgi:hypothetical protein